MRRAAKTAVIPAQAGIHVDLRFAAEGQKWIPACAGMT
jgi:hypothetical protein